jgi:hypothetical protein
MKGRLIVIEDDSYTGDPLAIRAKEYSAAAPLKDLKEAVGGSIESVPYWTTMKGKPCWVICNEEGKLHGLPLNTAATMMWWSCAPQMRGVDMLHGPVAILTGDGEFMDAL